MIGVAARLVCTPSNSEAIGNAVAIAADAARIAVKRVYAIAQRVRGDEGTMTKGARGL